MTGEASSWSHREVSIRKSVSSMLSKAGWPADDQKAGEHVLIAGRDRAQHEHEQSHHPPETPAHS